MFEFALKIGFAIKYSVNYYPQGNGLAKSTNENLIRIIKRTIDDNERNWHKTLVYAIWADRIIYKALLWVSPYILVYEKEAVLPSNIALPSLALVKAIEKQPCSSLQLRLSQILKLEEESEKANQNYVIHQKIVKPWFDNSSIHNKTFQVGDLVLKWDKTHKDKGKHTKFQKLWLVLFQITEQIGPSTFILQDLQGRRDFLPINGLILKNYFSWRSLYDFFKYVNNHMNIWCV